MESSILAMRRREVINNVAEVVISITSDGAPSLSVQPGSSGGGFELKRDSMVATLRAALQQHWQALGELVLPSTNVSLFFHFFDDARILWPSNASSLPREVRLPTFAVCETASTSEVAVPDYSFHHYHKIRAINGSGWPHVLSVIEREARLTPWQQRSPSLFWRGAMRSSPLRMHLIPKLRQEGGIRALPNGGIPAQSNRSNLLATIDVADTGSTAKLSSRYVTLDQQCKHKYLLYLPGNANSISFKYKLACGSLVVAVRSRYREFYHDALLEGKHYTTVAYSASADRTVHELRETLQRLTGRRGDARAQQMGANAQTFVREQLSPAALSCFWLMTLTHYVSLYVSDRDRSHARALREMLHVTPERTTLSLRAFPRLRRFWETQRQT